MTVNPPDELSTNVRAQADFRLKFGIGVALVMLASRDVSLTDVLAELERREGVSGIAEKAARL